MHYNFSYILSSILYLKIFKYNVYWKIFSCGHKHYTFHIHCRYSIVHNQSNKQNTSCARRYFWVLTLVLYCSVAMGTWCVRRASRTCWRTRDCATRPPRAPTAAWRSPRRRRRATSPSRRRCRNYRPSASSARACSRATRCNTTRRTRVTTGDARSHYLLRLLTHTSCAFIALPCSSSSAGTRLGRDVDYVSTHNYFWN